MSCLYLVPLVLCNTSTVTRSVWHFLPPQVSPEGLASLGLTELPEAPVIKGVKIQGGPQMLQLR